MNAAAAVLITAAVVILAAQPIAAWWARAQAELDRQIADALDAMNTPDLGGLR